MGGFGGTEATGILERKKERIFGYASSEIWRDRFLIMLPVVRTIIYVYM